MKKRFYLMGLAALTAAALLLSACNPAFEPSGDDFKGDWNGALSRSDNTNNGGPSWLEVSQVYGDRNYPDFNTNTVNWGPKAQIQISFTKSSGGFSLDENGIKAGVSIKEVTGDAPANTASAINQPNPVGSALAYTVLSLRDSYVILQLDLTSVIHNKLRVDIDATTFYANNGLKLNKDEDNTAGEEEDSYYFELTVYKNPALSPVLTQISFGLVNCPNPLNPFDVYTGTFVTDRYVAGGTGLVNGLVLTTSRDGTSPFAIANRAGIQSFLNANVIIEKYSNGSWTTTGITKGTFDYYTTDSYTDKWYVSLSGVAEGTILRARVQNVKNLATTGTINGYPAKYTTDDNAESEKILANPQRPAFPDSIPGPNAGVTQWIASGNVFDVSNIFVESDNGRNYRIVIPVKWDTATWGSNAIGYNGLASYDASHFVLVKVDNNYPVYVPVQGVTTRTTTERNSSNTLTTVVSHIVLDLGGFTTLHASESESEYQEAFDYDAQASRAYTVLSSGPNFNGIGLGDTADDVVRAVYDDVDLGYDIARDIADAVWAWVEQDYGNHYSDYTGAQNAATNAATNIVNASAMDLASKAAARGVTNTWNVLVNPAAKTAADTLANNRIGDKSSLFIGGSNFYTKNADYYGWAILNGDGSTDL
ncbi:hypothetical protein FACS1894141_5590 [Spirochaetia bacterium]|nr:hypothetical protein FACS1894141_5590 [Spirochaetia bacterium]